SSGHSSRVSTQLTIAKRTSWVGCRDRVSMAVDDLPALLLAPVCRRYTEIEVGQLTIADPDTPMLHVKARCQVGCGVGCDVVDLAHVTVTKPRRREVQRSRDVRPASHRRTEREGERHIISLRVQMFHWVWVALREGASGHRELRS